jgi:hypothetical protein
MQTRSTTTTQPVAAKSHSNPTMTMMMTMMTVLLTPHDATRCVILSRWRCACVVVVWCVSRLVCLHRTNWTLLLTTMTLTPKMKATRAQAVRVALRRKETRNERAISRSCHWMWVGGWGWVVCAHDRARASQASDADTDSDKGGDDAQVEHVDVWCVIAIWVYAQMEALAYARAMVNGRRVRADLEVSRVINAALALTGILFSFVCV